MIGVENNYRRMDSMELNCMICYQVLFEPVKCQKCKNHICRECMEAWIKTKKQCPLRCIPDDNGDIRTLFGAPDQALFQQLMQRKYPCANKGDGCSESIRYSDISKHQKQCMYKKVQCLAFNQCKSIVLRRDIHQHQSQCQQLGFIAQHPRLTQNLNNSFALPPFYLELSSKMQELQVKYREQEKELSELRVQNSKLKRKIGFYEIKAQGFTNIKFDGEIGDIAEQYKAYKKYLLNDYQIYKNKLKKIFLDYKTLQDFDEVIPIQHQQLQLNKLKKCNKLTLPLYNNQLQSAIKAIIKKANSSKNAIELSSQKPHKYEVFNGGITEEKFVQDDYSFDDIANNLLTDYINNMMEVIIDSYHVALLPHQVTVVDVRNSMQLGYYQSTSAIKLSTSHEMDCGALEIQVKEWHPDNHMFFTLHGQETQQLKQLNLLFRNEKEYSDIFKDIKANSEIKLQMKAKRIYLTYDYEVSYHFTKPIEKTIKARIINEKSKDLYFTLMILNTNVEEKDFALNLLYNKD